MVWCTISDLSDTSGPTPAGRQERQATKRSEKHWQNLAILLAHATCQSTSRAQVALDMCHMSQRDQAQWNSHINESRMSTPHKGSSCSAGEKKQLNNFEFACAMMQIHVINGMFLPAALMEGRLRPDFHLLHIYHPLACLPWRNAFHTLR